jgi:hypothetical protein
MTDTIQTGPVRTDPIRSDPVRSGSISGPNQSDPIRPGPISGPNRSAPKIQERLAIGGKFEALLTTPCLLVFASLFLVSFVSVSFLHCGCLVYTHANPTTLTPTLTPTLFLSCVIVCCRADFSFSSHTQPESITTGFNVPRRHPHTSLFPSPPGVEIWRGRHGKRTGSLH